MTEPLHPAFREALKRAHPDLTDDDIDRFEELTAQRFTLDPDENEVQLRELELERTNLLRQKMPQFQAVEQAFEAQRARQQNEQPSSPKVRIESRPNED
jgi:hypothetical protein